MTESSPASLRILFVAARFLPFVGGVEVHTYEVARRLAAAGQGVTILTTDPSGRLPAQEDIEGMHISRVRAWPRNRDYYFAPGIYRTITAGRWDVIHCQGGQSLVPPLAMVAALRSATPYFVTFHSGGHSSRLRAAPEAVQWLVLRPLLARAQRLVAVSPFEKQLFQGRLHLPSEQFVVVPNGSDLPKTNDVPPSADAPLIVSVGRLERYKGHHRVIAAMPWILRERPNAWLQIVGTGPYASELFALAEQLHVSDRVEIRSVSGGDRAGMSRILSRASLVTLLSEYESQGLAVTEAIPLGKPVLVANTSALSSLAHQGLATAIELDCGPQEVAHAVLTLLDTSATAVSHQLPTWNECVRDLLALYRSAVRGT